MKTKTMIVVSLLLAWAFRSAGQNFKQQFNDQLQKNDSIGQLKTLKEWEIANINDPELYVAYYNYYVNKSKTESIGLSRKQEEENSFVIKDSLSNTVGYLKSTVMFNVHDLNPGFEWIDKGIAKFPARLDMRFGKIYMLGKIKEFGKFVQEIVKTIDYADSIKNRWEWTDSKPKKNAKAFMLSAIQEYFGQLFNEENDSLTALMKQIPVAVLKYDPDNVENLSNLGVVYTLEKKWDLALAEFLKAEKLAPKDYIVLSNIAHVYNMTHDVPNAVKYYRLVVKYGDPEAKQFAQERIEEMTK